MEPVWIWILLLLIFSQNVPAGAGQVQQLAEGVTGVDIQCSASRKGTIILWFRALDNSGLEFIASFSPEGLQKSSQPHPAFKEATVDRVTLRTFRSEADAGLYGCATFTANRLEFGPATRLQGVKQSITPKEKVSTVTTAATTTMTTATPCVCDAVEARGLCQTIIFAPLTAACGLLLLLLILTVVYCNRVRTRRCPHHYKKKRPQPPGKQMMANRRA